MSHIGCGASIFPAWALRAAGGASSLLNGILAYWNLNEVSGTRADSTANAHDLTDNNTVGSVAGVNGNAASFVAANSESLQSVGAANLIYGPGDGDFTFSCWAWRLSTADGHGTLGGRDGTNREWLLFASTTTESLNFYVFNTIGGYIGEVIGAGFSQAAWHFIVFRWDSATNLVTCTIDTNNYTSSTPLTGTPQAGNANTSFRLGGRDAGALFFNGYIDEAAFWSRKLTDAEVTDLYNAGAGKFYPFA